MGLTAREAAEIIGITATSVHRLVQRGEIPNAAPNAKAALRLEDIERASLTRVRPGRPHHYWADTTEAMELLGVTRERVFQLIRKGFLPGLQAPTGRWYFRRAQLEVVANARDARRWSGLSGDLRSRSATPARTP